VNNRSSSRVTSRREFLKSAGTVGAALALASVPFPFGTAATSSEATDPSEKVSRLVPTVCGMCDANCGVVAYLRRDVVLKIEGNYNHSHSEGKICARGSAGVQLLYNPQRLQEPLKKTSDGRWEKISWEQALGEIGARLKTLRDLEGPETLAWIYHPRLSQEWDRQFMRAFGSPNLFSTTTLPASGSLFTACSHTLGDVPVADLGHSRYILMLGQNPAESIFVSELADLMKAKENGAHVVVADPRLSRTAGQAHEWLPIRPGTDGALLLGLMNVLLTENLYDAAFVEKHTSGFAELKALISDSTPGWASVITGIPADAIRRIARELAAAKPSCLVVPGLNATLYTNGVQTARAVLALNAMLGNYDSPGGLVMPEKVRPNSKMPAVKTTSPRRMDGVPGNSFPLSPAADGMAHLLPDMILSETPHRISALIVDGCNPVLSVSDRPTVLAALEKLELLVVIDVQGSDTADLADYVLPESTYLERFDPVAVSKRLIPEVALRQPVISPLYDTKPAHQIIADLATEVGLGEYFPANFDAYLRDQLRSVGTTPERLEKTGVLKLRDNITYSRRKFNTASGKINLYLESFREAGFDPLPSYQPPSADSGSGFRLLHGREAVHTGSSTQNIGWLNKLGEDNELWINADVAARLDIRDGDRLRVTSDTGAATVRAKTTQGIHPDAVFLLHGFGHTSPMQRMSYRKGSNDNDLIVPVTDPISGGAALGETIVALQKVH